MAKHVSEERGSDLLDLVFTVVTAQVGETVQEEDEETGETRTAYVASPALLTLAVKLLKDNQITVQPAEDGKVNELERTLAQKKKHSQLKVIPFIQPEQAHG